MNRPHYPTLFCNATLANDWDILEQIHIHTTQFPLKITWGNNTGVQILPPPITRYSIQPWTNDCRHLQTNTIISQTSPRKTSIWSLSTSQPMYGIHKHVHDPLQLHKQLPWICNDNPADRIPQRKIHMDHRSDRSHPMVMVPPSSIQLQISSR